MKKQNMGNVLVRSVGWNITNIQITAEALMLVKYSCRERMEIKEKERMLRA